MLLQDPFDPDEFVERMVRRSMQESQLKDDQFDPEMIHDIFTQAIQDLKVKQYKVPAWCNWKTQLIRNFKIVSFGSCPSFRQCYILHCYNKR